ncbi:hypothetical protein LBMAG42_11130 [Deltaproteobacteria bacterium]|nr:hypothetical protein LBMAG42_11130 [Deltaproteobacteria bacterium]
MMLLSLVACFVGTGEVVADRYDRSLECWTETTFSGDNWYWDEYTSPYICQDAEIRFATSDGECWVINRICGDHYLEDPRVAEATDEQRAACDALREEPHC